MTNKREKWNAARLAALRTICGRRKSGPWRWGVRQSTQLGNDGIYNDAGAIVFCNNGRASGEPEPEDVEFILTAEANFDSALDEIERQAEEIARLKEWGNEQLDRCETLENRISNQVNSIQRLCESLDVCKTKNEHLAKNRDKLLDETTRLIAALRDAINRPKGVVPVSAESREERIVRELNELYGEECGHGESSTDTVDVAEREAQGET